MWKCEAEVSPVLPSLLFVMVFITALGTLAQTQHFPKICQQGQVGAGRAGLLLITSEWAICRLP